MSIIINILYLALALGGKGSTSYALFIILTWAGVALAPVALIASPFNPNRSSTFEKWANRATDVITIVILASNGYELLPVLVVIEMVLLEAAFLVQGTVRKS